MDDFKGKNILVIGGSSGITLALVQQLTQRGASVLAASRHASEALTQTGAKHVELDVTSGINEIPDLPDTLHGLVYGPGTINLKPFPRLTEDDFMHDLQINVIGAVKVIQASLKSLKNAKGASVVLFSTVAARVGLNFHASIATAKSAIEGLTVSLAAEFAPSHIRFNAVAPSLTDTPLAHNLLSSDEKIDASNKRHPLGRVGKPEEIAKAAAFLLSDDAGWVSGQVFGIDGGLSTLRPL